MASDCETAERVATRQPDPLAGHGLHLALANTPSRDD
jgi:hypothetical protein